MRSWTPSEMSQAWRHLSGPPSDPALMNADIGGWSQESEELPAPLPRGMESRHLPFGIETGTPPLAGRLFH